MEMDRARIVGHAYLCEIDLALTIPLHNCLPEE